MAIQATHSVAEMWEKQKERTGRERMASAVWASKVSPEDAGIQRTSPTKKRKTPKSLEYLHDEQRTVRVGCLPDKHCEVSAVTDLFSEYGKVASVTVRKRPKTDAGEHDNWALVSFFNMRCVAEAVEAGKEGIILMDAEGKRSLLTVQEFDADVVFAGDDEGRRLWAAQRDGIGKGQRPWYYGGPNDYSFLVKLYKPRYYWFEVVVFLKKMVLAGVLVFLDPGSTTQLYVALALSFGFFGILEHCQPYKSSKTQRIARIAEVNLFLTISFVLMMRINLDGEWLTARHYDILMVFCTAATTVGPTAIAVIVSLRRIFKLWADSNPDVSKGDQVEIIDPGVDHEHCRGCVGKVIRDVDRPCLATTELVVEVDPKLKDDDDSGHRKCCRRRKLHLETATIHLAMERQQVRRIVSKKKVGIELCKIVVHSLRLARKMTLAEDTPEEEEDEKDTEKQTNDKAATLMKDGDGGLTGVAGPSQAAVIKAMLSKLKPVLEPLLATRGLVWDPVLPHLEKMFNIEEIKKALEDPEAAVRMLLGNPIIKRMAISSMRKLLEPLCLARGLTWLVFRSAVEIVTELEQLEKAFADPGSFFEWMLEKGGPVCRVLIGLLQPKLALVIKDHGFTWILVAGALELFATVEMLLVAMEVPDTWFEGILPKLKSIMNKGDSTDATETEAAAPDESATDAVDADSAQQTKPKPKRRLLTLSQSFALLPSAKTVDGSAHPGCVSSFAQPGLRLISLGRLDSAVNGVVGLPAAASTPMDVESVPEGWTPQKSTTTGDTYYVNSLTGETTWSRPTQTAAEALDEFLDSGPAVWQSVSSSTGKSYYFNTRTGATQWEQPADLADTREARRLQP